eukprot:TRINITY_DN60567_c0_g1_i2.p1 TRINITY_DN60567_c0_g1~~TRINITY_DN60567_c0_g1_i2.p1  ORF type:complete len:454 (-),score=58.42 TRINITY_DN60567_c0_g1_i2:43-1404(-)
MAGVPAAEDDSVVRGGVSGHILAYDRTATHSAQPRMPVSGEDDEAASMGLGFPSIVKTSAEDEPKSPRSPLHRLTSPASMQKREQPWCAENVNDDDDVPVRKPPKSICAPVGLCMADDKHADESQLPYLVSMGSKVIRESTINAAVLCSEPTLTEADQFEPIATPVGFEETPAVALSATPPAKMNDPPATPRRSSLQSHGIRPWHESTALLRRFGPNIARSHFTGAMVAGSSPAYGGPGKSPLGGVQEMPREEVFDQPSAHGGTYSGQLLGGQRHGNGTYLAADSVSKYEGQWQGGQRSGIGTLYYDLAQRVFYRGSWLSGQKHGEGTQTWPSGSVYDGQWREGQMHGRGCMRWCNAGSFLEEWTGEWRWGRRCNADEEETPGHGIRLSGTVPPKFHEVSLLTSPPRCEEVARAAALMEHLARRGPLEVDPSCHQACCKTIRTHTRYSEEQDK